MPHAASSASSCPTSLPLSGLRILELADGKTGMAGRLLSDLGAEVILVEPPSGVADREALPSVEGISLYFASHHANKLSVTLDLQTSTGLDAFKELLGSSDVLIDGSGVGGLEALGLEVEHLRSEHPNLLVISISDFGQSGPYSHFRASHGVHAAMSGVLCRSGIPGLPPLLPPGRLCWESAAVQAVWVILLGYWQRLQTGVGDHLDFSIYEAAAQLLDPGMGVTGSAAAGKSALDSTPHGRPVASPLYPIIACKDGHVRVCALNPRQWEGLRDWLGPDHDFWDSQFLNIAKRGAVAVQINKLIAERFSEFTGKELLVEAQRRGVPLAIVASPAQVLLDEHFLARRVFVPLELKPGLHGHLPAGYLEIDGQRAGVQTAAPKLGGHNSDILGTLPLHVNQAMVQETAFQRRPLEGVRVLDLGVIVAGAEAGRLMADQGAEVIKIENRAFPDGGRQSMSGDLVTPAISLGHRNKMSMGINLRSETGRALFKQLVAKSDVILSNFKPGTLDSLGLGAEVLKAVNPRIVMVDSSAMGNTGPQSNSLGYGPLVRASAGLTSLWRYPEIDGSFSDGVTVYPDHLAGRLAVIGALAVLIRRERTGQGGSASLAQAEIFINSVAEQFLHESITPGTFCSTGSRSVDHAPDGVYPCDGDDEWCVISIQRDDEWRMLLKLMGRQDLLEDMSLATNAQRLADTGRVDAIVSAWTSLHTPVHVTQLLQEAGIAAGFMQRLSEYRTDPQFSAREFLRELRHPGLNTLLWAENRVAQSLHMPDPELRPAPYQAEHTRELAARLLGLSDDAIEALIEAGDLEEMSPLKTESR